MIQITTTNKFGNISKQVSRFDTHMQALAALAKDAMDAGHDIDAIMLAIQQPFLRKACRELAASTVFPEKKKYADTFHFHPKSEEEVLDVYAAFKNLISDDMFDPKIKHVNLYNIQIHLL